MTNNYCIKNYFYDSILYNELLQKSFAGEKLTPEEEAYTSFCYHYEEWQAGLL